MIPDDFPQVDFDFERAWSACAGKLEGLRASASMALADAAYLWVNTNEPTTPERLKDLGKRLQHLADEESEKLQGFINEANRRLSKKK